MTGAWDDTGVGRVCQMYPQRMRPSLAFLLGAACLLASGHPGRTGAAALPHVDSGWPCAGRPDPTYVSTAEATGGQLFLLHPSEVADSGALMAASFTHRDTLFRVAGPLSDGLHEYTVPVDETVGSLLFSVSVQCLQVVEIARPSGALLRDTDEGVDYHQFEAGRVAVVEPRNPAHGPSASPAAASSSSSSRAGRRCRSDACSWSSGPPVRQTSHPCRRSIRRGRARGSS